MGPSGGAPSAWQYCELLHSFLGAYRIYNMEQNTLENWSMQLLHILGNTLWSSWM